MFQEGPVLDSAVKLKCIRPIPISTTPDATIVQMIRDRIRFSSAAGYKPRRTELFLQLTDRTEYKLVKEVGSSNGGVDGLVRIDSHRATVHSHGLGKPESAINGAGLRGL